jgi:3-mercaptopyruvate sulfurtransferase SseA
MAGKTNAETGKDRKLIYSSGVSAALLLLALYQIGIHQIILFDRSWAKWGVAN